MDIFANSKDNRVHLHSGNLVQILQEENNPPEDAFFICNLGKVVERHQEWMKYLPRIKPYYAVKCNDDPLILKTLVGLGAGFDCASENEMTKMRELGVQPSDIIFANPTKQGSHIKVASRLGIKMMTFDNERELTKVKDYYPAANLVLRLSCDAKDSLRSFGVKFGAEIADAVTLLVKAKQLQLKVVGVSFHVGTDALDPLAFARAIGCARVLFDVAKELGFQFNLLDIGGGFPGTPPATGKRSMENFGKVINNALEMNFGPNGKLKVIAEPGRYYVTSSCTMVTRIHSMRERVNGERMYYINDGYYGCLGCLLHGATNPASVIPESLKVNPDALQLCSIWGPTCDSGDKILSNVMLPKLDVGNFVIFREFGAYTLAMAGTFNGFPIPKVYYITEPRMWSIMKGILPRNCLPSSEKKESSKSALSGSDAASELLGSLDRMKSPAG